MPWLTKKEAEAHDERWLRRQMELHADDEDDESIQSYDEWGESDGEDHDRMPEDEDEMGADEVEVEVQPRVYERRKAPVALTEAEIEKAIRADEAGWAENDLRRARRFDRVIERAEADADIVGDEIIDCSYGSDPEGATWEWGECVKGTHYKTDTGEYVELAQEELDELEHDGCKCSASKEQQARVSKQEHEAVKAQLQSQINAQHARITQLEAGMSALQAEVNRLTTGPVFPSFRRFFRT